MSEVATIATSTGELSTPQVILEQVAEFEPITGGYLDEPVVICDSKRSFRRRLSDCFRKQDSNDWNLLQPTDVESKPWYQKVIRQRSVSEERQPSGTTSGEGIEKSASAEMITTFAPQSSIPSGSFLTTSALAPATLVLSDSHLTDYERNRHSPQPLRASFHGKPTGKVDTAENLIGRVLYEQGLGKYLGDPTIVRTAQRELAEACNMTPEGKESCFFASKTNLTLLTQRWIEPHTS